MNTILIICLLVSASITGLLMGWISMFFFMVYLDAQSKKGKI